MPCIELPGPFSQVILQSLWDMACLQAGRGGVERASGLGEAAYVHILAMILPSCVLNGLGLSFPTRGQMNMTVATSRCQ